MSRGEAGSTTRVLHVIASDARRGAEVEAVALNAALADEAPGKVVALAGGVGAQRLDVESLGDSWASPSTIWALRGEMRMATSVVAHGSVTLPAVVLAGVGLHVPLVYRNIGDPWFWASSARRRWQTVALLRRVRFVAALAPSAAVAIEDCWRVSPEKVVVTGAGRDSARFRPPTDQERTRARAQLGLGTHEPVVLVAGALTPEKQPGVALDVAEAMQHVTFLIAGDGPLAREVNERAGRIGPRVRVLGQRADIDMLMHAADVLLLTSASEGLPGVLIEAGLSGLPAVSTDVGYVSDVIVDQVTGILARSGTVEELVAGVSDALSHRATLGAAARTRCVETFDITVVRQRWRELLSRAGAAGGH